MPISIHFVFTLNYDVNVLVVQASLSLDNDEKNYCRSAYILFSLWIIKRTFLLFKLFFRLMTRKITADGHRFCIHCEYWRERSCCLSISLFGKWQLANYCQSAFILYLLWIMTRAFLLFKYIFLWIMTRKIKCRSVSILYSLWIMVRKFLWFKHLFLWLLTRKIPIGSHFVSTLNNDKNVLIV